MIVIRFSMLCLFPFWTTLKWLLFGSSNFYHWSSWSRDVVASPFWTTLKRWNDYYSVLPTLCPSPPFWNVEMIVIWFFQFLPLILLILSNVVTFLFEQHWNVEMIIIWFFQFFNSSSSSLPFWITLKRWNDYYSFLPIFPLILFIS